jgi:PAS domain S-box-containing protein
MHNRRIGSANSSHGRDRALLGLQAAALEAAANAVLLTDRAGTVVWVNSAFERLTGYGYAEIVGESSRLLKSGKNPPALYTEMWQTIGAGSVWRGELINRRKDGSDYHEEMTVTPVQNGEGQITHYIAIKLDISERIQADTRLRSLTQRLSLATGAARMGVWEWDLIGNVFIWDVTLFEIYGFSPVEQLPYARWAAAVHPEDLPRVEAEFRKAIAENGQAAVEFRILPGDGRGDGAIRYISTTGRAVLDEQPDAVRVIGVSTDVTERRLAEHAAEQSRLAQLQFKDEFLSHVSHELRSPLTAIKQFTSILLRGAAGSLNQEQHDYQQIILRNIRQLQAMIDDLLEVTRLQAGKLSVEPRSVAVEDAVRDALATFQPVAHDKGVALAQELPPDLPAAWADPVRLRQTLIILLDNAIKCTPAGGRITVQAEALQDPPRLLLRVSDTGCGIDPAIIGKLFERLYQAPGPEQAGRNGLGLGLYICKQLVALQGGRIWVESEPQHGACFSFTLPAFAAGDSIVPFVEESVKSNYHSEGIRE